MRVAFGMPSVAGGYVHMKFTKTSSRFERNAFWAMHSRPKPTLSTRAPARRSDSKLSKNVEESRTSNLSGMPSSPPAAFISPQASSMPRTTSAEAAAPTPFAGNITPIGYEPSSTADVEHPPNPTATTAIAKTIYLIIPHNSTPTLFFIKSIRAGCSLHGVGASLLSVIIRGKYTCRFPHLVRIAVGNY